MEVSTPPWLQAVLLAQELEEGAQEQVQRTPLLGVVWNRLLQQAEPVGRRIRGVRWKAPSLQKSNLEPSEPEPTVPDETPDAAKDACAPEPPEMDDPASPAAEQLKKDAATEPSEATATKAAEQPHVPDAWH